MDSQKQLTLKPQDLAIALKIAFNPLQGVTFARLSSQLQIAASQIHSSFKRLAAARLIAPGITGHEIIRPALREFVLYGARYSFPAVLGPITRGVPTSYAAQPLKDLIVQGEELPPVWPSPQGEARGPSLIPLYQGAPQAALEDRSFYEALTLFDALRSGAARERELAFRLLSERL